MKMNRLSQWLLVVIILLAAFLRFYQLGVNPPALSWDEVAWGYNAYSVGIDGRDEFGHFLPYTSFVSFGDYKPPVYAYLDVVPVWLFGLTAFAVRFPSALFGTLTVLMTYFLVKELFNIHETEKKNKQNYIEYLALTAALIMALSPWNIMLSRAAFEANVASFFIVFGVWAFLFAVRKKSWILILSVVSFVLCMYTFNSVRVVAPLLCLLLVLTHIKYLWNMKKATVAAFIVGILLLAPIVPFLLSSDARLRYQEVNIFSDFDVVKTANQQIANNHNAKWSKFIDNRRFGYGQDFLKHYFDNLNPGFLFITGDPNPKFSTQDIGQMYLWDLPFFVIGILFLFRERRGKWWLVPLWLLLGIIPAAVAEQTPHALRTEATLPTWQILTAYGFVTASYAIKRYRKQFVYSCLFILLLFVGYYQHGYYTYYPQEYSLEWQYGYDQIISYIKAQQSHYDRIYISGVGRGYIYPLFFLKYPPQQYRKETKIYFDTFGFAHVVSFNKYTFMDNPGDVEDDFKALYIAQTAKVPSNAIIMRKFYLLNGTVDLIAYKLRPPKKKIQTAL